jgi:hypothetical protein
MSDLYVFSIGSFLVLDGSGTLYFGRHEGRLLPSPHAVWRTRAWERVPAGATNGP